MKKLIYILCMLFIVTACKHSEVEYPIYTLDTVEYVPDSLKVEYRNWIQETVRAASQHMTGGDYEDTDVTIRQAKWTADELFGQKVMCLRKEINDSYYDDILILSHQMTEKERKIFKNLIK